MNADFPTPFTPKRAPSDALVRIEQIRRRSAGRKPIRRLKPYHREIHHWERQCPRRFVDASLDSAEVGATDPRRFAEMLGLLRTWVANPSGNLVIAGPVGTGKTYLGAAVCRALAESGKFCGFGSVGRYFDDCKPGGAGIDQYLGSQVLMLDDVGSGRATPTTFEEDRLYCLVNERWQRERLTIVTTNLDPVAPSAGKRSPLAAYLGDRTNDRLRHEALIIVVTGESRRTARWGES